MRRATGQVLGQAMALGLNKGVVRLPREVPILQISPTVPATPVWSARLTRPTTPSAFEPSVVGEFPDLSKRPFLKPTLHVGMQSSSSEQKEDLYRRIERRLEAYQKAESKSVSNGLKADKLSGSTSKGSLKERKLEVGLRKKLAGSDLAP